MEVLRIFLDTLFHWIASGTSENNVSDTYAVAVTCNKQISALLQSSITLLSQFESQLSETVSQEHIINVLQFIAVEAIFLENQGKDNDFIITNQGIESLRVVSMGILRQVNILLIELTSRFSLVIQSSEVLYSTKFYRASQSCLPIDSRPGTLNSLTASQSS